MGFALFDVDDGPGVMARGEYPIHKEAAHASVAVVAQLLRFDQVG